MPNILSPRQPVRRILADFVRGATVIKREAIVIATSTAQDPDTGVYSVGMVALVRYYAVNEDGTFGVPLAKDGWPNRKVELNGNNDCVVDPATGAIQLVWNKDGMSAEEWERVSNGFSSDTMLQGDHFETMRDRYECQRLLQEMHLYGAELMGRFEGIEALPLA